MLTSLQVRDLAVVERIDLEWHDGLTVLTGETGAGKSIVVDALGLVLGDRADSTIVRHGKERAEIMAAFDIQACPEAGDWLNEQELDDGGECLLRRTVSAEGGSRAYINGRPVTLQQLRQLGDMLVDIHGQHEHQRLLKRDQQRRLLDGYAAHDDLVNEVNAAFVQWQQLQQEYDQLRQAGIDRERQLELLRFQVQELEALAVSAGEIPELAQEQKRLASAEQLIETCQQSLSTLYDEDESITAVLARLIAALEAGADDDRALQPIADMLGSAAVQIQEAAAELRSHADQLEPDPGRLREIDDRLGAIHDMARKHHIRADELPALVDRLGTELHRLEHAEQRLDELLAAIDRAGENYRQLATRLTAGRKKAAKKLDKLVSDSMNQLGMPGGHLFTELQPRDGYSRHGLESVEFLVATNPGQPAQPLTKIASGGELSRISLAIQVITANRHSVPTLIFDEVDVGIGGGIAEIVGQQLRTLGANRQVLCVTHLPQVASRGHHHLRVSKTSHKQSTVTAVEALNKQQRSEEIARMLGGIEITAQGKAHAAEMIARADAETVP